MFLPNLGWSFPKNFKKLSKKNSKMSFWLHFLPDQVKTGQKREKKNINAQPRLEHSKKNSKHIVKKFKQFFFSQTGLGQAEKEKKKLFLVPFLPDSGWSIPKKIVNKFEQLKKLHSNFISSQTESG